MSWMLLVTEEMVSSLALYCPMQGLPVLAQPVGGILEQLADIDPARASYIHGILLTDPQCGHLALTLSAARLRD